MSQPPEQSHQESGKVVTGADREKQFQTMLMVYPRLIEDLHEWQRRQWHVVYYALLLLGAVSAMSTELMHAVGLPGDSAGAYVVLGVAVVAVVAAACILCRGLKFINMLEDSAVNARKNIKLLRNDDVYKKCFLPLNELPCTYDSRAYDDEPLSVLRTVLWAGFVLTALFVVVYSLI